MWPKVIKYFSVTVSFGEYTVSNIKDQMSSISFLVLKFAASVKSLISLPCFMSHVAILVAVREATKDVRQIPVGIEDVSDL